MVMGERVEVTLIQYRNFLNYQQCCQAWVAFHLKLYADILDA